MPKVCLRDGAPFGVCLIREGKEVGTPATPVDVGTLATIANGTCRSSASSRSSRGRQRFRILERRVQPDGLQRAASRS